MFIHITLYFTVPKAFTLQKAETYKQQKRHAVEDKRQQSKSFPVSVCTREQISAAELLAIAPIPIALHTSYLLAPFAGSQNESRISNGELQCRRKAQVQEDKSALEQNQSISLSAS